MSFGGLGSLTFDRVDTFFSPCADVCRIDLRHAKWVDPYAMVDLACHMALAANRDTPIELALPQDDSVAVYLDRMDLVQVAEGFGADIKGRVPRFRRRSVETLLTLRRFSNSDEALELQKLIKARLESEGAPRDTIRALWHAAGEAMDNALCHSDSSVPPFMAAQAYPKTGDLIVGVGDCGVGIRTKLIHSHAPKSDSAALDLAIKRGVTSTDDPSRGQGLADLVHEVVSLKGAAVLRSGEAVHTIYSTRTSRKRESRQQGTVVGLRIPCRQ